MSVYIAYPDMKGLAVAKVTIYLADDLAERVRAAGISMSPVCQAALEKEVQNMTQLAEKEHQMERIEVNLARRGAPDDNEYTAAFVGRWLLPPNDDNRYTAYDHGAACGIALTQKNKIAVYTWHVNGRWRPFLEVCDDLAAAQKQFKIGSSFIRVAAAAIGGVVELDI
jgi:post-segregation antitoxin (ccd killing protein)